MRESSFLITTRDCKKKTADFKRVSFGLKNWIKKEYFDEEQDLPLSFQGIFDSKKSLNYAKHLNDSDKNILDAFEQLVFSSIKYYIAEKKEFSVDDFLESCISDDYFLYKENSFYIYNEFSKITEHKGEILRLLVEKIRENESEGTIFLILHKSDGWVDENEVFDSLSDKNIQTLFFEHEPYDPCYKKIVKKTLDGSTDNVFKQVEEILLSDDMLKLRERKIWGAGIEDYTALNKHYSKVLEEEQIDLAEATESDIREKIKDLVYG